MLRRAPLVLARRGVRSLFAAPPATPTPAFAGEPTGPCIVTDTVPGPKSLKLMDDMNEFTDARATHFFVDFAKSVGNYVVDADGNTLLDLFGHIASLPLGYNHPNMIAAFQDPKNLPLLIHRPANGNLPPLDWPERIRGSLLQVAPKGLDHVMPMMCGSCSNENALKAAFIRYMARQRGDEAPTEEDVASCMQNAAPGSPPLTVLSFHGSFHGRLMGCMSATRSKALHKLDIPAFDWPAVPFPRLKYPLAEHAAENAAEENASLEQVEDAIERQQREGRPVAAMIVEPIQAEGGDNHASADFFRRLQAICKAKGVAFVVDEVQTGCGVTGHFWAHEAWDLPHSPDIVTFSKKMQIAGYYCGADMMPSQAYRIFNTWIGHPVDLLKFEAVTKTIHEEKLLENAAITGEYLLDGLTQLQQAFPQHLSNARGQGTFCAIDAVDGAARDGILGKLRNAGVEIGGCGDKTIRFRPSLVFTPKHASIALDIFNKVLREA